MGFGRGEIAAQLFMQALTKRAIAGVYPACFLVCRWCPSHAWLNMVISWVCFMVIPDVPMSHDIPWRHTNTGDTASDVTMRWLLRCLVSPIALPGSVSRESAEFTQTHDEQKLYRWKVWKVKNLMNTIHDVWWTLCIVWVMKSRRYSGKKQTSSLVALWWCCALWFLENNICIKEPCLMYVHLSVRLRILRLWSLGSLFVAGQPTNADVRRFRRWLMSSIATSSEGWQCMSSPKLLSIHKATLLKCSFIKHFASGLDSSSLPLKPWLQVEPRVHSRSPINQSFNIYIRELREM